MPQLLTLRIADIVLLEDNPRTIADTEFGKLVIDIRDDPAFLLQRPPLINHNEQGQYVCYAGNQRVRACEYLGMDEVQCFVEEDVPLEVQRKRTIIDNTHRGEWDMDAISSSWSDLPVYDWGMPVAKDWTEEQPQFDPNRTEAAPGPEEGEYDAEPRPEPVTVLGDLYELNNHRIHCGDSCDVGVVDKTLNGAKPYLMITDPPYGVEYDPEWRNDALREDGSPSPDRATGKVENDDQADWTAAWAISPAQVAYVWHAGLYAGVVAVSLQSCDFQLRSQIIWAKSNFAISRGHYHWKHEPCWYAVKKGSTAQFIGDHSNHTVWEIAKPHKSETGHGTQKPIECMSKPMRNHKGDVYDPFLGSGTTLVACEQNDRTCYAQELNPAYVDVGIRRWVKYMRENFRPFTIKRNGQQLTKEELSAFID